MSDHSPLLSISPVDGRYSRHTSPLAQYFSEFGLIRYRVLVEIEYLIELIGVPELNVDAISDGETEGLRKIYSDFSISDALEIKEIEQTTNHDVKAVEYFIKRKLDDIGLSSLKEFIHFGLTSQDVNNTAIPLILKDALENNLIPAFSKLEKNLIDLSEEWKGIPMLAKTHGQPASPTTLGKEIEVFRVRLNNQLEELSRLPFTAKFGGATGNFNAHKVAYPDVNWNDFANHFVNDILELKRSYPTTQIEHYDGMASIFDTVKRINTVLLDLSKDFWQYISMSYFKQKVIKNEVGSSAMPHKVNPIDFENAEGNLGIANALFEHLSSKLPVSRLQRDLTDSTVLRNIGVPVAHTLIALKSLEKGLGKVELNKKAIDDDLNDNWAVVAEAIQTILRREKYPDPYEKLKELTRTGGQITETTIKDFIDKLDVPEAVKNELKEISPFNYTGYY